MLEIIDEAKEDIIGSLTWYMERSLKAAEGFQKALRQAYEAILDAPELGGSFDHQTRRYQLKKYPFLVIYQIEPSCIRVIAVAHKRRRSGFWKQRR